MKTLLFFQHNQESDVSSLKIVLQKGQLNAQQHPERQIKIHYELLEKEQRTKQRSLLGYCKISDMHIARKLQSFAYLICSWVQ